MQETARQLRAKIKELQLSPIIRGRNIEIHCPTPIHSKVLTQQIKHILDYNDWTEAPREISDKTTPPTYTKDGHILKVYTVTIATERRKKEGKKVKLAPDVLKRAVILHFTPKKGTEQETFLAHFKPNKRSAAVF